MSLYSYHNWRELEEIFAEEIKKHQEDVTEQEEEEEDDIVVIPKSELSDIEYMTKILTEADSEDDGNDSDWEACETSEDETSEEEEY
jgi:hypothetical protein